MADGNSETITVLDMERSELYTPMKVTFQRACCVSNPSALKARDKAMVNVKTITVILKGLCMDTAPTDKPVLTDAGIVAWRSGFWVYTTPQGKQVGRAIAKPSYWTTLPAWEKRSRMTPARHGLYGPYLKAYNIKDAPKDLPILSDRGLVTWADTGGGGVWIYCDTEGKQLQTVTASPRVWCPVPDWVWWD